MTQNNVEEITTMNQVTDIELITDIELVTDVEHVTDAEKPLMLKKPPMLKNPPMLNSLPMSNKMLTWRSIMWSTLRALIRTRKLTYKCEEASLNRRMCMEKEKYFLVDFLS